MIECPTPRQILETLLPPLRLAAGYARHIQTKIAAQPEKENAANPFAAALTDADLSIQTFVEVALLGAFPQIRFYGEEYEKSYNTKYFRALDLGEMGDYLVTLDPIDGTRFYMDGHPNYQIIVTVLNRDDYEAVLAISPALDCYYYALRGQGTFLGQLHQDLDQCDRLSIPTSNRVFLGTQMAALKGILRDRYEVISIAEDYSATVAVPTVNGLLTGGLAGAVLAAGQFIDGAALAFLAREAGHLVTALDGSPLPPLYECQDYRTPGLIVAATAAVQGDLVAAMEAHSIAAAHVAAANAAAPSQATLPPPAPGPDRDYGDRAIRWAATEALEKWPNASSNAYTIHLEHPEFTALCPRSGYLDFGTIVVDYQPQDWVVELKAFKLYVNSFRDQRISHEAVANAIADRLWTELSPIGLRVIGDYTRRGGVKTVITVAKGDTHHFAPYQPNLL